MKSIRRILVVLAIVLFSQVKAADGPRKLETLTTSKGRVYQKVEIREVTPSGVKILHDSGTATIPFQELPGKLQTELGGFDSDAAEAHRKKLDAAVREQEQAIESEMAEIQKSADAGAVAPEKPTPKAAAGKKTKRPGGLAGQPVPMTTDFPASAAGPAPTAPAPAAGSPAPKEPPAEKGILSARIVGYRSGIKRVEFKVRTNCQATLEVHQVIPDEHSPVAHTDTFAITPNADFVREVWVYNNYSSDLFNGKGERLDSESTDTKTRLGGLARPTLR